MKILLYCRYGLVDSAARRQSPAVLLEGSWPESQRRDDSLALDDVIDGRFEWVDCEAERLASAAARWPGWSGWPAGAHPAWISALALRYELVKLIRVVAFLTEVRRPRAGGRIELVAERRRDEGYAHVVAGVGERAGAEAIVRWRSTVPGLEGRGTEPSRGRRWAARLAERLDAPLQRSSLDPRVVLCGNPALLGPVCSELLRRGAGLWWLYHRWAARSWLRWRPRGVGQLVCDLTPKMEPPQPGPPGRLECHGVDLGPAVWRWLVERLRRRGATQQQMVRAVDAHFRRLRPDWVLLDQDATPLARAAVVAARRWGARTAVIQHGAPCCRFGFAPLEADLFFAWGPPSRDQLVAWGVPAERILLAGHPRHCPPPGSTTARRVDGGRLRVLVLATMPPRDERPDAAALHLTRQTYREMLRWACAVAVERGAELVVRLHPRADEDSVVGQVLAEYPRLRVRVVRRGSLERWVGWADCVLSCVSSAGVEAAAAGAAVIQLLPAGSVDILPATAWGMLGTARSFGELHVLMARAVEKLADRSAFWRRDAIGPPDGLAAARMAAFISGESGGLEHGSQAGPSFEPALGPGASDAATCGLQARWGYMGGP